MSHEARLSMMVITLLVVAFGLIVFNKVDHRQRQLTQAAIPSPGQTASDSLSPAGSVPGIDAGLSASVAPADPPVFSEEESFDTFDGMMASPNEGRVVTNASVEPLRQVELTTSEPEAAPTDWDSLRDSVPSAAPMMAATDAVAESGQPADAPELLWSDAIPGDASEATPANQLSDLQAAPAAYDSDPLLALNEPLSTPAFDAATDSGHVQNSDVAVAGEAPFGTPESFDGSDTDKSVTSNSDIVEFEPELPAARTEMLMAANDRNPFGSGRDAVISPASRVPARERVRNTAGSGAGPDGRFSLAAFNQFSSSADPAPDNGEVYDSVIVQAGDNYTKISKRVYGTGRYFSALAVFNQHRIADPSRMRPGMVVLTPSREVLEKRYPQLFEGLQPAVVEPAAFLILDDGSPAYRVGERETLSEIAERFLGRSSRWVEIYRLNRSIVNDPNKLKPGTILALPGDATEVRVVP